MPIYLEPDRAFPVVLDRDKDKPQPPTFWAKSLPMRLQAKVADALDQWWAADVKHSELLDNTLNVLLTVFVRLENMPGATLTKEWLFDHLTYQEARELLRWVLHNNHLDHESKKD